MTLAEFGVNVMQFALPAGGVTSILAAWATRGRARIIAEQAVEKRYAADRAAFAEEQRLFRDGLMTRISELETNVATSEERCASQMVAQASKYETTIARHEAQAARDRHQIGNMRTAMKMVCLIPGMSEEKVTEIIREVQDLMERSDAEERLAA